MGMASSDFDIAVVGAGPAGLTTALALADSGARVVCLDRRFGFDGESEGDTRTIALFRGSVRLLKNLGVWEACAPFAAPLEVMRIVDDTGRLPKAPDITFRASEVGPEPFGYNIPNERLTSALANHAQGVGNLTCHRTEGVTRVMTAGDAVFIATQEGDEISVPLVVGADGPDSVTRRAAGIAAHEWRYDQIAVACWFSHSRPHEGVSTEFHRPAGPLVVVPMLGDMSGLVWVEHPAEAKRLMTLDDAAFSAALESCLGGLLGHVTQVSARSAFPLMGLTARQFGKGRTVLVGHAAHVIPPIGAQGLNLGFRDAAVLADLVQKARKSGADVGGEEVVAAYDAARRRDVLSRTFTVDMLNRSLLVGWFPPVQLLRGVGLQMLKLLPELKRVVMRHGMTPEEDLPPLMRTAP